MKEIDHLVDAILLVSVIALIAIPAYYFDRLPEEIPIHFDAQGTPGNYNKKSLIWLISGIGIVMVVGLRLIRDQKESFNYPVAITEKNKEVQYQLARRLLQFIAVICGVMFSGILWSIVKVATQEWTRAPGFVIPVFILVLFGGLIVYMRAVYRANRSVHR